MKISKKQGNKNLLALARFLAKLPPHKFNFGLWASADWAPEDLKKPRCGTTACAMGWVPAVPYLTRQGVGYHNGQLRNGRKFGGYPEIGGQLFAIDANEFRGLFVDGHLQHHGREAKGVARGIREFVAGRSK